MAKRRSKKLEEADRFRAMVERLRFRDDVEWREYEEKFLETQVRRPDDYIFSDRQWKILKQLLATSTLFTHYAGESVPVLFKTVYLYRAELDEHGEDFVTRHYKVGTMQLAVRDICYLARLYRKRYLLEQDERVESVLGQTWDEDAAKREADEDTVFSATY
jgi:hypothetical protein